MKPIYFEHEVVAKREWGEEILIAHAPNKYIGKLLKVNAGHGGGLQFHRLKDESDYLLSGTLKVIYDNGGELAEDIIEAGQTVRFPNGVIHKTEAITDCVIIEFSTPHFNDRVRVEEEYGLPTGGGLPTTKLEDVITK